LPYDCISNLQTETVHILKQEEILVILRLGGAQWSLSTALLM